MLGGKRGSNPPCSRDAHAYLQRKVKVEAQVEQRSIRPGIFSTLNLDLSLDLPIGHVQVRISQPPWPSEKGSGVFSGPCLSPSAAPMPVRSRPTQAKPCSHPLPPQRPLPTGNRDPKKDSVPPFVPPVYSIRSGASNLIQRRIVFDSRIPHSILLSQLPHRRNSGKNRRLQPRTSAI